MLRFQGLFDLRRIATLRPLFAIPFGLQLYLLMGRLIPSTKPLRRGLTSSMKAVARGETEPSVGIRLLLPPSCLTPWRRGRATTSP